MKRTNCLSLVTLAGTAILLGSVVRSNAQTAETSPLVLEDKIALGEVKGRIDHMAFDPVKNRLFVAELENNSVGIVDLNERKIVHVIKGLTEPQGIGHDQATDTLYVANGGDGSVRMFSGANYSELGRIALGDDADNIRIDPDTGHLLVGMLKSLELRRALIGVSQEFAKLPVDEVGHGAIWAGSDEGNLRPMDGAGVAAFALPGVGGLVLL